MCSHCADVGELRRHETVLQSYMFERSALKFQFHCQLVQSCSLSSFDELLQDGVYIRTFCPASWYPGQIRLVAQKNSNTSHGLLGQILPKFKGW